MKKMKLLSAALALAAVIAPAADAKVDEIDIPFTKYVLDNGLTLIVHEDRKAPIVAVNVWYHVGSNNEKLDKTGFAHLFEHLMFNGSENYNDDYFKPFDRIGATDMNGTTNFDRTNYFQNVPTTALDVALFMESDRMGHLLGAIDQARLDEQRGVVQNEKRQGENQPYGQAFRLIFENTYPAAHPYSHSVIGSLEDLDAASVEDVHEWFKTYYGAANATIVIAGDIDPETALEKVEAYFGDIPAGPPVVRQEAWIAKREQSHRMRLEDRVPQARVYKAWNTPEWGAADSDYLNLVSDVLGTGKTSRLHKRLVHEEQIASDARAFVFPRELGGLFMVQATALPGQDLGEVERIIDEELQRFLAEGPTAAELERVRTQYRARFVRGVERIGGFGGKSDILAQHEVYGGDPAGFKTTLERVATATASDLQGAARSWLSSGELVLEVHPFSDYKAVAESGVDRSKLPEVAGFPTPKFPAIERTTLANGLEIVLAEHPAVPVVEFELLLDAGYAADQFGKPGTASLALTMLDESTKTRDSLQIADELARLGADLQTGSNLDQSSVSLSALKANLGPSLEIFADVILNPSFPEADFERMKNQQLAQIQREKKTPIQMALRVFPALLYGRDHAYGLPFTGSGSEESVAAISRDTLSDFHATWFKPNHAKLVVVGDTTMSEIKPKLAELFASWKPGEVPTKNVATVAHRPEASVYLIDRPDSLQSIIFAGHIAPPKGNPNETAIEAMNEVLGGGFSARINMNLREDKHWSYGARSLIFDAQGQRPFLVYAPVQTDKTKESMQEIQKEISGIIGGQPPTADELGRAKDTNTLTLPGRWETAGAVLNSINEIIRFGLADSHWNEYAGSVRELDLKQVTAAAQDVVQPAKMVWVVVGDRAKVEAGIRELNLGDVEFLDADGNLVTEVASAKKGEATTH